MVVLLFLVLSYVGRIVICCRTSLWVPSFLHDRDIPYIPKQALMGVLQCGVCVCVCACVNCTIYESLCLYRYVQCSNNAVEE